MGHDVKNADIGVGQLLDFGNALKLEADGKTAPIKNIFSTPGYWSPEILTQAEGLRLTPTTDIYSVGCLMLYLLKGMRYKKACGRTLAKNFSVDIFVPVKKIMTCGYRREAAGVFRKILAKALQHNPQDRYQNAEAMLKDILFLKKIIAPPKFTLSANLSRSPYFVKGSRDRELAFLQRELDKGTHPLWIWGIGGLGKTELAMEFARKQIELGRASYLVTFRGSIRETVLNMNFSGWQFEFDGNGDAAEKEYRARLDLLKENYKDALLIVDNFDHEDKILGELQREPAYKDLLGLDMKILFTTRSRPNNTAPELEPLNEENSLTLFKSIAKVDASDEEIVRKLIREVDCHPMTVEILAHTLNESWGTLTPKELLNKLQEGNLNVSSLPEIKHLKAGTEREAKIYGHLKTLFSLLCFDEDYRDILCDLTLLPPEGFDAAEFLFSESNLKKKQLKQLERRGWIRRRPENNLLCIHPLIRNIFRNELKPTNADCKDFLLALWSRIDDIYPPNKTLIKQAATVYIIAAERLSGESWENYYRAGYCHMISKSFVIAEVYGKVALNIQEKLLPESDCRLAKIYSMTGLAKLSTKWHLDIKQNIKTAETYIRNAFAIFERTAPNSAEFAQACANLSLVYEKFENYPEAVRLAEKAIEIFEISPPKNKSKIAFVHGDIGRFLIQTKDYERSLKHLKFASEILETLAPKGNLDLVRFYRDIAECYKAFGKPEEAVRYAEEIIKMQERFSEKDSSELGEAHGFIAELYDFLWQKTDDEEYLKKFNYEIQLSSKITNTQFLKTALKSVRQAKENHDNNDLVRSYIYAAEACLALEKYPEAEKYILAALQEIFPKTTNPYLIKKVYYVASQIYKATEIFDKALSYAEKSFKYKAVLYDDNPDWLEGECLGIILIYFDASKFYAEKKDFDKALNCAERSIIEYEAAFPDDSKDFLATEYLNICNIYFLASRFYAEKKDFDKALSYAERSIIEYEAAFPDDSQNLSGILNKNVRDIQNAIEIEK